MNNLGKQLADQQGPADTAHLAEALTLVVPELMWQNISVPLERAGVGCGRQPAGERASADSSSCCLRSVSRSSCGGGAQDGAFASAATVVTLSCAARGAP